MSGILRKAISLALVCVMIFTLIPSAMFAASLPEVRVDLSVPGGSVIKRGDTFTVDVVLSSNSGFCAMSLLISFDSAAFSLVSKDSTSLIPDRYFVPNASLISGAATLAWQDFTAKSDWTKCGTVATLTFTAKGNASLGEHFIRVAPVANAALSTGSNSVSDVVVSGSTIYMNVAAADSAQPVIDMYLSSAGSDGNDGLSAAKPKRYLDQALQYVIDHGTEIGDKDVVIHISGKVYSSDPNTGSGNNKLGLAGLERTVTVTSTDASAPGVLIHPYNINSGITGKAIILQNAFRFSRIRFASFPASGSSEAYSRILYCNGFDLFVGEDCTFTNANLVNSDLSIKASSSDPASSDYGFTYSIYGGGIDGNTRISRDFTVSVAGGSWNYIAPAMTYGGKITSQKIKCEIKGDAVVTKVFAGPCATGDSSTNAFYRGEALTSNVYVDISGSATVTEYLGGCSDFANKDHLITGNVVTTVSGSPTITKFFGGGDYGSRTGSITNVIRGGNFVTNFYGGGWGLNNQDKGTTADISTAIYGGKFSCAVYGAGYFTPTVGKVSLSVVGDGVNGADNRTYVGVDKGVYGGSGSLYASVTGDITLTLSGAYLDASVYAAGRGNVYGDIHVFNNNTYFYTGRNFWLGNQNTGASVFGDVYLRMTGGTIPGSFNLCGYRKEDDGTGYVTGNAYVDISGGTFSSFYINANCDPNASSSSYGHLLGNAVLNVDVSVNNVKISAMNYLDGIVINNLIGGEGTLEIPSGKYIVVDHFQGNGLNVISGGFAISGAMLTLPEEDVSRIVKSISVKVGGAQLPDRVSVSKREHIWYKTDNTPAIDGVKLIPDDQVGMKVVFNSDSPTSDGQYQYSLNGGNTYETVTYSTGGTFEGLSGTRAYFTIPAIQPSRFCDTILLRPNKSTAPVPYSVSTACTTVIDSKSGGEFRFDEKFRSLAQSILNYGNCAQDYFEYNADHKILAKNPVNLKKFDDWSNSNQVGNSVSSPAIRPIGTSLVLTSEVHINVWFRASGSINVDALTVRVNGVAQSNKLVSRSDDLYSFDYAVSGRDISTVYTFQVFSGSTAKSNTFTTSVGSYCNLIRSRTQAGHAISDNDAALVALCESIGAMFHYRDYLYA